MQQNFNPYKHSIFTPMNKEKYNGKEFPIVRSEWERKVCQWLDANPNVLLWSSERLSIEYFDPVRQKKRRYYPDFLAKMVTKNGKEIVYLIEVKPLKETKSPKVTRRKSEKTLLREQSVYMTNIAKFRAADIYCKRRNWIFKVLTEKELFGK